MPTDTLTEEDKALIEELVNDHEKFNKFVYTPIEEALKLLEDRSKVLDQKHSENLKHLHKKAVLARHLVTPNYEIRRFMGIADAIDLEPIFFEYLEDKLVFKNSWKYSLGKIPFYCGWGKGGGMKIDYAKVIDFDKAHGEKISSVKTLWDEPLTEFHHKLFYNAYPSFNPDHVIDASKWYANNGESAQIYYGHFLTLFLNSAILFENFYLSLDELDFTKDIVLPSFIHVLRSTGIKPLIVALEPTDIEGDPFWLCHPNEDKFLIPFKSKVDEHIKNKML